MVVNISVNGPYCLQLVPRGNSRRSLRLSGLLDCIPKRFCVVPDASVARHNGHELRGFAEQLSGSKVHGIERANGFNWKRSANTREHRVCHSDHERATLKPPQCTHRRTLFVCRQPRAGSRAKNRSRGLRDRQRGRNLTAPRSNRPYRRCVMFQQRGNQPAGLDVSNIYTFGGESGCVHGPCSPRGPLGATLRHDRRQSDRRHFLPEAEYLANLPSGHLPRSAGESLRKQQARQSGSTHPSFPRRAEPAPPRPGRGR